MDCRRRRTSNTYRSDRAIYDQLSSSRGSFSYSLNGFCPAVSLLSGLLYQVDITPRPSELCECVFYPPEEALSDHTAYQQDPLPPSCEVYSSSAGSLNFSMRHTTKRYLAIGVMSPAREVCMTRRRIRGVSLLGAHGPSPWQDSEVSSCLTRHSGPLALLVLVVTNQPTGWYYHTIMLDEWSFTQSIHLCLICLRWWPAPAGTASSSSHFRSWRQIRGSAACQECYMHFIVLKSVAWAQTFSRVPRRNRGVIWVTPAHMNPVAVSGWILNLADGRIFTIQYGAIGIKWPENPSYSGERERSSVPAA
ncbi:hypothetical protein B0H14DRAFT_3160704 [Mycena olivaceomarginata]|nr:hypothetical protein B0H14DRAFT_3160704 [Mycena olivaceomarginata]